MIDHGGEHRMDKLDRIFQLDSILSSRRTAISLEDLMARLECNMGARGSMQDTASDPHSTTSTPWHEEDR